MVANGTPFADAASEVAFRTWLNAAWVDSGCTQDFACLYQASSVTFTVNVKGVGKSNVWWGDGSSSTYSLDPVTSVPITHTYGSVSLRPIVILGGISSFDTFTTSYGGRAWSNLRSTVVINVGGVSLVSGSISALPVALIKLYSWGCPSVAGDVAETPAGATYLGLWKCNVTYSGGKQWPIGLSYIQIDPTASGLFTSAMADALLIDTSSVMWGGEKTIDLRGNCGGATALSNDAVDSLLSQGVTVLTN